jgi:periplasmic protein TonB
VLRGIGFLDLALSASRLAVPIEETRSALQLGAVPAAAVGPALTLCTSVEPLADAAVPIETDGVTAPSVLSMAQPRFPERALLQGASGTVVETVVDVEGRPHPACVVDKLDRDLEQESLATVRRWRFAPARRGGKPVAALITIGLSYNIARR